MASGISQSLMSDESLDDIYVSNQRCKFIYEDMTTLMNDFGEEEEGSDNDEDEADTECYRQQQNFPNGLEKILDVVALTGSYKTDPGMAIQELASIIFSLYQNIDHLSEEFDDIHKKMKINLLEQEQKYKNSMRNTGSDLLPYLPVPFKTGLCPNIPIKSLNDIVNLSREEVNYMLKGYGVLFDSVKEPLIYQKQRLAIALGLDPNCILLLEAKTS